MSLHEQIHMWLDEAEREHDEGNTCQLIDCPTPPAFDAIRYVVDLHSQTSRYDGALGMDVAYCSHCKWEGGGCPTVDEIGKALGLAREIGD